MSHQEMQRLSAQAMQPAPDPRDMAEWAESVHASVEIQGYSLYGGKENDSTLDSLIGVPFVMENVTYQGGTIIPAGEKEPRDYMSCEVLIHPAYAHAFTRKRIVFNDASTGIYRQVTKILATQGNVNVSDALPENGGSNATRYDSSFTTAESPRLRFEDVRIFAPAGLRKSEYTAETGTDAITWYLA